MSSVISVHVGRAGLEIGAEFWKALRADHGIASNGTIASSARSDDEVFFRHQSNRGVARAVLVDLNHTNVGAVRNGPGGGIFRPDGSVYGTATPNGNWAEGYLEAGEIIEDVAQAVEWEAQRVDGEPTFLVTHSLAGGGGGGAGTKVLERLRADHPGAVIISFALMRYRGVGLQQLAPYAEALSMSRAVSLADLVVVVDQSGLAEAASYAGLSSPTSQSTRNALAARALAMFTAPLRFPVDRRPDAREMARVLAPRPHLNVVGLAADKWGTSASGSIGSRVAHPKRKLSGFSAADGKLLGGLFMVPAGRTLDAAAVRKQSALGFRPWFPAVPSVFRTHSPDGAILFAEQHTGVRVRIEDMANTSASMLRRKAFLTNYQNNNVTEAQIDQANSALTSLASDYGQAS